MSDEARVQLVSSVDGQVEVNPQAIDILQQVDGPIAVVAISGVYRTGKSALLNEVFSTEGKPVFDVGTTVGPTTDGIWMWASPFSVTLEKGQKARVFILDCEGLGSFRRDQSDDAAMFMLALISSSYFIYNSIGKLGEAALAQLSMLLNLQEHVGSPVKEGRGGLPPPGPPKGRRSSAVEFEAFEATSTFMPFLAWILRDFTVPSDFPDPADYLAHALEPLPETSEKVKRSNRLRRAVCALFPDRDCFAFPNINLRSEFQAKAKLLRDRVLADLRPKSIDGKLLTGKLLAGMLTRLVASIAQGVPMNPFQAWEELTGGAPEEAMGQTGEAAVAVAVEAYRRSVEEHVLGRLPLDEPEFEAGHRHARAAALERLAATAADPETGALPSSALAALKAALRLEKRRAADANHEASTAACRDLLARLQEAAMVQTPVRTPEETPLHSPRGEDEAPGSGRQSASRATRKSGTKPNPNSSAAANGAQKGGAAGPGSAAAAAAAAAERERMKEDIVIAKYLALARGPAKVAVLQEYTTSCAKSAAAAPALAAVTPALERAASAAAAATMSSRGGLHSPDGSLSNTPRTPRAGNLPTPRASAPAAGAATTPRLSSAETPRSLAPIAAAPTPAKASAGPIPCPASAPFARGPSPRASGARVSPRPSPTLGPMAAPQNPSPRNPVPSPRQPSPRLSATVPPLALAATARPVHVTRDVSVQTPRAGEGGEEGKHSPAESGSPDEPGSNPSEAGVQETPRDELESDGLRSERELDRLREELKTMQGQVANLRLQLDQARATATTRSNSIPASQAEAPVGWLARVCGISPSLADRARLRCGNPNQLFGCLLFSRDRENR